MKDLVLYVLDESLKKEVQYADIRVQDLSSVVIEARDEKVETVRDRTFAGAGVRVLVDGVWGYSSTSVLTKSSLMKTLTNAIKLAKARVKRVKKKVKLAAVKTVEDSVAVRPKESILDMPLEEKMDVALTLSKTAKSYDKRVVSTLGSYGELFCKAIMATTEGTYIELEPMFLGAMLSATAKEGEILQVWTDQFSAFKGFELMGETDLNRFAEDTAKKAVDLLRAEGPPAGSFPTVTDQVLTGVMLHESFGHLSEADLIVSGFSVLKGCLGEKIASDIVTTFDDGSLAEGAWVRYDDEGVPKERTNLIVNGVLKSFLHSRETAAELDTVPTGNARAQDFENMPLVRQTNTCIEPRGYTFDELIEDVDYGVYAMDMRGGQGSPDGTFYFAAQGAYLIEHGKLTKLLRDVSLSGNILASLKKIDAIGKDFKVETNFFGGCGKDQRATVGFGAPHLRFTEITVGGVKK